LQHDLRSTRADGRAGRDFLLSTRGAGQEQVRDIAAGDQENEPDGRENQPEGDPAGAPNHGVGRIHQIHRPAFVGLRILSA
jgi:hypothetical protein